MKLLHFPAPQPGAPDPLPAMLLAAAWIEVIGGGLLALGLFTRPAAHAPRSPPTGDTFRSPSSGGQSHMTPR